MGVGEGVEVGVEVGVAVASSVAVSVTVGTASLTGEHAARRLIEIRSSKSFRIDIFLVRILTEIQNLILPAILLIAQTHQEDVRKM